MKIGIMTFHKSINYGSVLQAYALALKLKNMGHEVEIIDYEQCNYGYQYNPIKMPVSFSALKHDFVNIFLIRTMFNRKSGFEKFRKKYLPLTDKEYFYGDDLSELDNKYDFLICGSDQIWNTNASDFDMAYFFPFAENTPKISYAPSLNLGELSNAKNPRKLKKCIMKFKALSAREDAGKDKILKFIENKKNVKVVLDPTLLNYKDDYEEISSKRVVKEKYIFFYSVNYAEDAVKAVEFLSNMTGLPVYTLPAGKGTRALLKIKTQRKINVCRDSVAPEDFLSLIKYADYVVTNSFHGTAFSIIFEKNFFSIRSDVGTDSNKIDARLYNILSYLDLQERYLFLDEFIKFDIDKPISYKEVNKKREKQIIESVDFLKNNLEI